MTDYTDTITVATRSSRDRVRRDGRFSRVLKDRWTIVGSVLLVISLGVAVLGPLVAPYEMDQYLGSPFAPPSAQFPLGLDYAGQDVLSRVLRGGWTVVWMSLLAATLGTVFGVLLGVIAGYRRGWIDQILMRVVDVWMAFPAMVLALLVIAMFGRAPWLLVLLVGIGHVPSVARVVRGLALDIGQREYVESAQALGGRPLRVVVTQMLPNMMNTLMVEYGLRIVWSTVALAGLAVLGLGIQAPQADWGLMINENRAALAFQPLPVLAPLAMLACYALALNFIAEGVARSFNVSSLEVRS